MGLWHVPGNVLWGSRRRRARQRARRRYRHFGWLRLDPFWCGIRWWKGVATQIAGSLASKPLARARQLFYGLLKATCQATCPATLGTLVGCGSPLFCCRFKWWKGVAIQIAGSLASEPLARARQLFYGLPKATCQAMCQVTLSILAGCGSPLSGLGALQVSLARARQPPENDVPGNVPGDVRHFGWLRLAPFWYGIRWQLFYGRPKATCQATCQAT